MKERGRALRFHLSHASGTVDASEEGGSTVAVVAAVGDHPDVVAVGTTAVVRGPTAFQPRVHHTGLGDIGRTVARLDSGWNGGGEDEQSE